MMAVTANGRPTGDQATAERNGQAKAERNGHARATAARAPRRWAAWAVDKAAKALVWYTIATVLLACPRQQADLADTSPRACTPYLQARDVLAPYAQPYYRRYVWPHVHRAQPYYHRFHENVGSPAAAAYRQHAAPLVAAAQQCSRQQWQRSVRPQLHRAQKRASEQYQRTLAPHVRRGQRAVQPYYDALVASARDVWQRELQPVYRASAPVATKAYALGRALVLDSALPQARFLAHAAWAVWTRHVWPRLGALYGENVEPQLLRITQRLGRYRDGRKLEADGQSPESSSRRVSAPASAAAAAAAAAPARQATASPSSSASVAAPEAPEPSPEPAVQFQQDLQRWHTICATAVDEGADDLRARIKDITAHHVSAAESLGAALTTQLQQTTEAALNTVKARTRQIVQELPRDADAARLEAANGQLVLSIRAAGASIKQRAQAVREWRQTSQAETDSLIKNALESTLETIDGIRELRLTEIGRKYASSSLPHKEWSRYNDIKKAAQTWRNEVVEAVRDHAGIAVAEAAGEDVEHTAMAMAENAAAELARLKQVGKWKIAAHDASEDFTTTALPPPVRQAQEAIKDKVWRGANAQVIVEAREPILDEDVVDRHAVFGESIQHVLNAVGEQGSQLTRVIEDAMRRATATPTPGAVGTVTSLASEQYESALSAASSVLFGSQHVVEHGTSAAKEQYLAAVTAASHAIYGTPITAAPLAAASSAYDDAISAARAHHESAQKYLEHLSSVAASRLAEGVRAAQEQYQNAKMAVGAEPTPAQQQYLASAQSAYYQALGMAHGRYSEFVEAASSAVLPTPAPTGYQASISSALSAARSAYSERTQDAHSRYSALRSVASSAASERGRADGGSTTVDQSVLEKLEGQMAVAVGEAKSKLSLASASASSLYRDKIASETGTPLTEQAAQNWDALMAKASEQIYGAPPPVTAQAYSRASEACVRATEAAGVAAGAAAAQYEQVQALVSELVSGKEEDYTASVYRRLQSAYSTVMPAMASQASSYVSDGYESIASAVSAGFVPPTEVPTILEQVQSQLNAAVDAASAQVHGGEKGFLDAWVPHATEAAASVYSDAASAASSAIYGTEMNSYEAAQATVVDMGASASSAISRALYGPPTPTAPVAASAAASVSSSMSSEAARGAASARAAVSRAICGEEQSYVDGVQKHLQAAVADASRRISALGVDARRAAEEAASTASSVVSRATHGVRDEL